MATSFITTNGMPLLATTLYLIEQHLKGINRFLRSRLSVKIGREDPNGVSQRQFEAAFFRHGIKWRYPRFRWFR